MGGLACAAAWLAGLALQMQQPAVLVSTHATALLLAALALVAAAAWRVRSIGGLGGGEAPSPGEGAASRWRGLAGWASLRRAVALLGALASIAAAAYAYASLRAEWRLATQLDPALEGVDLQLVGTIARLPQSNLAGTRFVFAVESATRAGQALSVPQQVPDRLALGWYRGFDADALLFGAEDLRAGQRWRLPVRLRQPHGQLNPHGFDHELWLFEQDLRATGSVRSRAGDLAHKLADDAAHPVERWRQAIRDRIDARVKDPSAAGVLAALAVGDQGAIDRADWDLFRITGVAHLMSISGLHVTMFAWLAAALVGRMWRWSPRLMRRLPAPHAARWGGLALALAYAVLAGFGVPAQRTVLMLAVLALLRTLGLRWPPLLSLLLAAFVVTLVDPWALLQPGFWLSFAAVGLLMVSDRSDHARAAGDEPSGPRRLWLSWWVALWAKLGAGLRTQAVASFGLAPLSLVFFQQLSLVGFGANLLAIPLVTLLITPLALLGVLLPPLWDLAAWLVQGLTATLGLFARWPWASWAAAAAPAWAAALGLAGGALLVAPLPWRLRLMGLPLMLPLLAPPLERPAPGRYELVALDIGQGSAVLVRTANKLLLYDTGPAYSAESDAGQRVLLPLLQARGEPHIDLLVLSHRDADHVGGAATLLARQPVRALQHALPADHALLAAPVARVERCAAGLHWSWDGVDFEVLHPDAGVQIEGRKPNSVSCVLRIVAPQGTALLAGDIERAQELALVERAGGLLPADLLLVPHHGSKTSSSEPFLAAVAPRIALVQAAYRSRFGHPAPEVLARYAARGVRVVRSDRCGAFTWAPVGTLDDPDTLVCQRQAGARYWHHRAGRQQ